MRGPSTERAKITFSDQMLVLHGDGSINRRPYGQLMDVRYIGFPELDPRNDQVIAGKLRKDLQDCLKYDKEYPAVIADSMNRIVAGKALFLLKTKRAIDEQVEAYGNTTIMIPSETEIYRQLGRMLFRAHSPNEYAAALTNMIRERIIDPQLLKRVQQHIATPPDSGEEALLREEIQIALKGYGIDNIVPDGKWPHIFSKNNERQLEKVMQTGQREALDSLPARMSELRTEAGTMTLSEENSRIERELRDLPLKAPQDVGALLQLALNDPALEVVVADGPSSMRVLPDHSFLHGTASYSYMRHRVYVPKEVKEGYLTFEQELGKPLPGVFSYLSNMQRIDKPPGMDVKAKTSEFWEEELFHAALKILFENRTLPYSTSRPWYAPWEKRSPDALVLQRAMARDLLHNPELAFHVGGYNEVQKRAFTNARTLAATVAVVDTMKDPLFESLAKELIVKVLVEATEKGWDEAKKMAPAMAEYAQTVVLPLAQKACKERGYDLPAPGDDRQAGRHTS
jgi:hypothetical protein